MKRMIITLLATTALAAPALAANTMANPANPPPQPSQMQQQKPQQQSQAKPQTSKPQQQAQTQTKSTKSQAAKPQQQAQANPQNQNQPIAPKRLSRTEVRQMQAALDKQGFKAGRPDGRLGPKTRHAVQAFNQKKGIQSSHGRPTEQTLAQLGINTNQGQN